MGCDSRIKLESETMKNLRIYDNGGKTIDRYTVIYMDCPEARGLYAARGMNAHPFHPLGFGMFCTAQPGRHLGKRITFDQLPVDCQKVVMQDIRLDSQFANEVQA